ncbi:MAG: hypothetical protein U0270_22935 [Labilithrix sp.]
MRLSRVFFPALSAAVLATALACSGGGGSTDLDASTPDSGGSSSGASSSGASSSGASSSGGTQDAGPKGPTDVKDTFNHACATDDDCTTVFIGETCGICSLSNTAIASSDKATYQKAYNDARANCPPVNVAGSCAAFYGVSQCGASKTCTFIECGTRAPVDEHHCQPDGG